MYFSYFVLFARFFYTTYLSPTARKGKYEKIKERSQLMTNGAGKVPTASSLDTTVAHGEKQKKL